MEKIFIEKNKRFFVVFRNSVDEITDEVLKRFVEKISEIAEIKAAYTDDRLDLSNIDVEDRAIIEELLESAFQNNDDLNEDFKEIYEDIFPHMDCDHEFAHGDSYNYN